MDDLNVAAPGAPESSDAKAHDDAPSPAPGVEVPPAGMAGAGLTGAGPIGAGAADARDGVPSGPSTNASASATQPPPGDLLVDTPPHTAPRTDGGTDAPGDSVGEDDAEGPRHPAAAAGPAGGEPGAALPEEVDSQPEGRERADWLPRLVDVAVVAVCMVFVWLQLHPHLLLTNNTPSGGDMGAHVWGPAYLRDHLLPHLRLSGWTPDWYAGFPAYTYYMVVPALAVVGLDLVLPYGIAFKLVTVAGVIFLPLAAYALGRLFRLRFPGPALLAIFTLPFLFDTTFTIYGGNIASTLAGEFAFSISLTILLVYL